MNSTANGQSTATKAQTLGALPPEVDATQFAPVDTEEPESLSPLTEDPTFVAFLNRIGDYATAQSNSPVMWERRRKAVKLRKYTLGEYYGIFDKSRGFVSAKEEGDGIYYDPQTATIIDSLVASLIKTRPTKKCEARNRELIEKREAARVAEKLLAIDDDQHFTPKKQQREWKWNLLGAGETYRITYFNSEKQGAGVLEDVFEQHTVEGGDSAVYCSLCSSTVADESGKCANCKNPQMDEYKALGTTLQVKKGKKYKQIGDVDYDVPDSLEMTVIGETDSIAEALIVVRDRMIPRCVLEDALGQTNLPQTGTPDLMHYRSLFDSSGDQGISEFELLHYQEFWLAPAVYASLAVPADTKLANGETIPKGTKTKELFPAGMYFTRIGKKICQIYPQGIGECLSHAVNSVGEGFHGQGEWDLLEQQDQLTEAKSMKMNSLLLDSTQPLMARQGFVDTDNLENKFGLIVPIAQDATDRKLDDIMGRVPASQPPSEAYAIGQEIKGEMQQRTGNFSTDRDAPDIKAMGTATGVAAIHENTLGRRAPALQLYAQMEVDQAYQKLELRQKYWCKKMYDSIATDLGEDAVKWFMKCNIRQDINIAIVPDSWMPRTQMQKEAGFEKFLAIAAPILSANPDPKMLDELLRQANELFGGGINFNDFETEQIEAQLRLDQLKEVAEFVEQQMGDAIYDPMGGIVPDALVIAYMQTAQMLRIVHPAADQGDIFANLPLDVMLDNHAEFEEAYSDWLKTAEGRAASLFVRTLIWQLANYHMQAEAFRLFKLKQYANLTQLPDLEAELLTSDAMHAQQLDQNSENVDQEMQMAAAQQVGQAALDEQMGANQAQPPVDPKQKVAESIKYSDLPPEGQSQVAQSAGISVKPSEIAATIPPRGE